MTAAKLKRELRVALGVELATLALTIAWVALLLLDHKTVGVTISIADEKSIRSLLGALLLLLFAAGGASLLSPTRLPEKLRTAFRPERDNGLVIGCVLVPIVLLSRLVAQLYQDSTFSGFTLLYAWTSVSVATSAFIRLVLLRTSSLRLAIAVDLLLAPALLHLVDVEETAARSVLPAACCSVVSVVFASGVSVFPRSFTLGEAMLVAQGIGMTAFDLMFCSAHQVGNAQGFNHELSRILEPWGIASSIAREDYVLALQVGLTGSLLVCVALAPLLRSHGASSPSQVAVPLPIPQCIEFAVRSVAVVGLIVYPWSCLVLETLNPFEWLFRFIISKTSRLMLIAYWLACLVVLVPLFGFLIDRFAIRNIVARKLFHALVVLMFVPAYYADAPMLVLSYGVALSVFCLLECVRALSLPPCGQHIAEFMKAFIDHREAGRLILTHSYLLLGCALPLWLSSPSGPASSALAANAGILALGIGDAMGAAVGSCYGKRKLIGSKTLEGTLAIFVSIALGSLFFHDFHIQLLDNGRPEQLGLLLSGVVLTSVLETCTSQIDNLVLPLFFFAICNLISCHSH